MIVIISIMYILCGKCMVYIICRWFLIFIMCYRRREGDKAQV